MTTLHCIHSAVVKLSKLQNACKERGISAKGGKKVLREALEADAL